MLGHYFKTSELGQFGKMLKYQVNVFIFFHRTTILTALARAIAFCLPNEARSLGRNRYHVKKALIEESLSSESTQGLKEGARSEIMTKLSEAEAIVKHVFAIHPNLEDICNGLLAAGLDSLSEHVQLTVGPFIEKSS